MQNRKGKKSNNDSVTIDYLDKRLNKMRDGLIFYMDQRFKPLEEAVNRSEKIWGNVAKTLNWLVTKFKKFDEGLTILTGKYPETNEKLENHEKRIQVLEKKTSYH